MDWSSFLKPLLTQKHPLVKKQRLMVIVTILITAILITVYAASPLKVAVEPLVSSNSARQIDAISNNMVISSMNEMTYVSQTNQRMRDPFALPPDLKEEKSNGDLVLPDVPNNISTVVPNKIDVSKPPDNLKLTGIVSTVDQLLAVIMLGNKSRAYKINDFVGRYKLIAISQDAVILTDVNRTLILHLGLTEEKGGTNSGK